MRKTCEIFIELDAEKAIKDGMKIYISKNNVILTSGFEKTIPVKYFK